MDSKCKRLQDFYRELKIDYDVLAKSLVGMLKEVVGDKPMLLSIDRTDWEARKNVVNLFVLSVCLGDAAQPLLWTDLRRKGNSTTAQRIELVSRFIENFGRGRIEALVADREFVGEEWFSWLLENNIPFAVRLKENFLTRRDESSRVKSAKDYFKGLQPGQSMDLGLCEVCGVKMNVRGLRVEKKKELLVIGYSMMHGDKAQDVFMKRWNIETGFQKLKSHGFNMEDSRLRGEGKYERLMAVLAVGFAWCYAVGHWSVTAVKPIRFIQKLMRPAACVFRRGLDLLCGVFHKACPELRLVSRWAFEVLKNAFLFTPT